MRIANPHLLWLLLATPAVVLAYAIAFARRRRLLNRLGQPALTTATARQTTRTSSSSATRSIPSCSNRSRA